MLDVVNSLGSRSGSSKDRDCHEDERKDRLEEVHGGRFKIEKMKIG